MTQFIPIDEPDARYVPGAIKEESRAIIESSSTNLFIASVIKDSASTSACGNYGVASASNISMSSLYEHVRGYVYRDFSRFGDQSWHTYLASTAGQASLLVSKISGNGLNGVRIMSMNKSYFGDRIKIGSFRMTMKSYDQNIPNQAGLNFENDSNYSGTTGCWAGITGQAGLTGSISAGVSGGKTVTGFTIFMRIKPTAMGGNPQTLFYRKHADPSASSIGSTTHYNKSVSKYPSDYFLNALSLSVDTLYPDYLGNYTIAGTTYSPSHYYGVATAPLVFKLTNSSGGIFKWAVSGDGDITIRVAYDVVSAYPYFAETGAATGELSGNWFSSSGSLHPLLNSNSVWGTNSSSISYFNPAGIASPSGNSIIAINNVPNRTGSADSAYFKIVVPPGSSGLKFAYTRSSSGIALNNTVAGMQIRVYLGEAVSSGTLYYSLYDTLSSCTCYNNSPTYHSGDKHIDLLPFAPQKEEIGPGTTAWVGFESAYSSLSATWPNQNEYYYGFPEDAIASDGFTQNGTVETYYIYPFTYASSGTTKIYANYSLTSFVNKEWHGGKSRHLLYWPIVPGACGYKVFKPSEGAGECYWLEGQITGYSSARIPGGGGDEQQYVAIESSAGLCINGVTASFDVDTTITPIADWDKKTIFVKQVNLQVIPSTIYGLGNHLSTTASISAVYTKIDPMKCSAGITFYSRPKNTIDYISFPRRIQIIPIEVY